MIYQLTRGYARRSTRSAHLLRADGPGDVVDVAQQIGATKIDPSAAIVPAEATIPGSR